MTIQPLRALLNQTSRGANHRARKIRFFFAGDFSQLIRFPSTVLFFSLV